MLPERLSTDLTSLNPAQDRLAIVTEMVVAADGSMTQSSVYRALVRNQAKLAYDARVGLDRRRQVPCPTRRAPCRAWTRSCAPRTTSRSGCARAAHAQGSLELETFQPRARVRRRTGGRHPPAGAEPRAPADRGIHDRDQRRAPRASWRTAVAPRCGAWCARPSAGCASWRWPAQVRRDAAEAARLASRWRPFWPSATRPTRCAFPDLSLVIVKLMGSGEYVVEQPGRRADRPLRSGGARLHPLHRAEPALSRT